MSSKWHHLLVKTTDLTTAAFQGEKHEGFNVLYHNMKSGSLAAKELTDYFRERAKLEEENAKTHQVLHISLLQYIHLAWNWVIGLDD